MLLIIAGCASTTPKYEPKISSKGDFWGDIDNEVNMTPRQRELILYGKQFLGTKYVWGGETPQEGFDCSGFTQYIYARTQGIALPRTTKQQHKIGRPVSYRNLQPGDLVFLDLSHRLSHVGVYIGNGKFFHASSGVAKKLIIADLRKKYFAKRFNSARRVL